MKKKIFIALIAIVVVTAIVGSAFAVYAKDAEQIRVSLGTGDSVTLGIAVEDHEDPSVEIMLSDLAPNKPEQTDGQKKLSITLTATNLENVEAGIAGLFKVTIAPKTDATADVKLANAIGVSALGEYSDHSVYSADKATLLAGDEIALNLIPTLIDLTFTIDEASFLDGAAEGKVKVTLSWTIIDNWEADSNKYYIVTNTTAWKVTRYSKVLSTEDLSNSENTAELMNVEFAKGEEFKIVKGNGSEWFSLGNAGCDGITRDNSETESYGNAVVGEAGYYNIYLKDKDIEKAFYVAPVADPGE